MKLGYARVSTRDQNLDLQVDALKRAGCEHIYRDIAGGSKTARPALDEMLGQLRAGDVIVIWKLDRMGRSLAHLVELVGDLVKRKVGLVSQPSHNVKVRGSSTAAFSFEVLIEQVLEYFCAQKYS